MPEPAEEAIVVEEIDDGLLHITCGVHSRTYITQARLKKELARTEATPGTEIKVTLPKSGGSSSGKIGSGGLPKPGKISSWIGGVISLGRRPF